MSWLSDLFNPPAASVQTPSIPSPAAAATPPANVFQYDPSQIYSTQNQLLGGINNLGQYNTYGQLMPQAMNIGQGMINDPNAWGMLSGASTAAGLGERAARNEFGVGGQMYGLGNALVGSAFDPQQALYGRTLSNVTDQARANAAAAGLGQTPIGASTADWATNQFNIDWQNQQLQRQIAGAGAAGQMYQGGAGLQAGASPLYMQSAAMPWQAGQQIGNANLGTLNQLGQFGINAAQIPGQQIAGWQQALQTMLGAQGQSNQQQQQQFTDQNLLNQQPFNNAMQLAQLQLQQNQMAFNQQQQMMQGLGKVLGGVGGFALGGIPGAAVGSNVFGGGGGTSGTGWGNMSNMSTQPFGGLFSNPATSSWGTGQPQMGSPTSFGLPGSW
jgi:hypothetical protein